jgi:hypothetical protein
MKRTSLLVLLIPLLTSCLKDLDFDNVDNLEYRGQWVLPVLQAELTLEDVVAEDSTFTVDSDGGIRIIFEEDSIFGASIAELVVIPDQDPQQIPFIVGQTIPPFSISLGTLGAGEQLKNITMAEGKLKWSLVNPNVSLAEVEVAILNASLNGDTAKFKLIGSPNSTSSGEIDISGLDFQLEKIDNGVSTFNNLSYRTQILNDGGASSGTKFDATTQLVDIVLEDAIGYFGDRSVNLPSLSQNTNISGFESILNGLRIENPTIDIKMIGNIGIPFQLETDMDGINKNGNVLPLSIPPAVFNAPTVQGDWDTSHLSIDRNNSNIVDFISNVPKSIAFAGKVQLNPNGNTGVDNFITGDGELKVGIKIDIPLEIKTQDLLIEQTIQEFSLGIEEEQTSAIEKLKLHFKVTNGFPFDADLKLVFFDVKDDGAGDFTVTPLDSVDVKLLTSAVVDASGRVITPTVTRSEIEFDQENISNLIDADRLQVFVTLNTFNNGNDIVKLYTDDFIKIVLGVDTKLKYKL